MCRLKLRVLIALVTFSLGVGLVLFLNAFNSAPVRLEDVPAPLMPQTTVFSESFDPSGPARSPCCCLAPKAEVEAFEILFAERSHFDKNAKWGVGHKAMWGGALQGKAISTPQPVFPPTAKSARVSRRVVVRIVISEEGKVIGARVVSGHPLLEREAINAACQSLFAPTLRAGQPVKVSGTITYNFVRQ